MQSPSVAASDAGSTAKSLEERLERGEVVTFTPCPFPLPDENDRAMLFQQRLHLAKKNISYNPHSEAVTGFEYDSDEQEDRLTAIMKGFSLGAQQWLRDLLPGYARAWRPDRASFRPEEEATRKLRLTARNDLLHIDAFPTRPTRGDRILRLYVNINPIEPRVWVTADTFETLLSRYGAQAGVPQVLSEGWAWRVGQGLLGIFQPGTSERTVYDRFMLRFHHFLKTNDPYQERAGKRFWSFAPGTAWLVFTDALAHAELRGQYALEHSFFIAPESLVLPELAPAAVLERVFGKPVLTRAA